MCKFTATTADNVVYTKSRLLKPLVGHVIDLCLSRGEMVYALARESKEIYTIMWKKYNDQKYMCK